MRTMWTIEVRRISLIAGDSPSCCCCGSTYNSANAVGRIAPVSWDEGEVTHVAIPLPPMGCSSWSSFSNTVDSNVIIKEAKALVASGLKAKGYDYVNIDEGWCWEDGTNRAAW